MLPVVAAVSTEVSSWGWRRLRTQPEAWDPVQMSLALAREEDDRWCREMKAPLEPPEGRGPEDTDAVHTGPLIQRHTR